MLEVNQYTAINRKIRQLENNLQELQTRRTKFDWHKPNEKEQIDILDQKIGALEEQLCEAQEELSDID